MNPYDEGFDAGFHDRSPTDCPYDGDTNEFTDWVAGYEDGIAEAWAEEEEEDDDV